MPVPFGRTSTQSYLAFFIGVLSLTGRCVPSNPPYTPRARIGSPRPPLARDTAHEGSRSAPHAPAQVHALPARSGRTSEGPERTRRAIRTELPPRHTTTPPSDAQTQYLRGPAPIFAFSSRALWDPPFPSSRQPRVGVRELRLAPETRKCSCEGSRGDCPTGCPRRKVPVDFIKSSASSDPE